jgi:hypothetical protein
MATTPEENNDDLLAPIDIGRKLVIALRSVTDPQAIMQSIADRTAATLRGEFSAKIDGIDVRIVAMDKAATLWHEDLVRVPTEVQKSVQSLRELMHSDLQADVNILAGKISENSAVYEEKFTGVGTRFNELNTRLTEGDRYKQTALDAALKAAQTLVDKQQENNKESIKKTEELFGKQIEALQGTVDELKGAIRQGSGASQGASQTVGFVIGASGVLVAVVTVVISLMRFAH